MDDRCGGSTVLIEDTDDLSRPELLNPESECRRAALMRSAATRAFHKRDVSDKLHRALERRGAGQSGPFLAGSRVFFWTPGAKKGRMRPDPSLWRGPATVIALENGGKQYFSAGMDGFY